MTEALVLNEENLLGLAVVGYISFDVNSSGIEAGSAFGPTPAGDQDIFYHGAYIEYNVPSTTILKLLMDPWMTPINQ